VKEFLKSVKICQSYCRKFGGFLFLEHSVVAALLAAAAAETGASDATWRIDTNARFQTIFPTFVIFNVKVTVT